MKSWRGVVVGINYINSIRLMLRVTNIQLAQCVDQTCKRAQRERLILKRERAETETEIGRHILNSEWLPHKMLTTSTLLIFDQERAVDS